MRRIITIGWVTLLMVGGSIVVLLDPIFANMASEYETAAAIGKVEKFVLANQGQWPSSKGALYPEQGPHPEVLIDYKVTTSELLADPERLRSAIRPQSGKFYTYPHYDEDLKSLLKALQRAGS